MRLYLLIAAFTISGCTLSPKQAEQTSSSDKPNIIFILVDNLGYGGVGSFGQKKIRTPQLDKMANEGVRFTQFYAGSTTCAPSRARAALMTGKHTGENQIRGNFGLGAYNDEEEFGQLPLKPVQQLLPPC